MLPAVVQLWVACDPDGRRWLYQEAHRLAQGIQRLPQAHQAAKGVLDVYPDTLSMMTLRQSLTCDHQRTLSTHAAPVRKSSPKSLTAFTGSSQTSVATGSSAWALSRSCSRMCWEALRWTTSCPLHFACESQLLRRCRIFDLQFAVKHVQFSSCSSMHWEPTLNLLQLQLFRYCSESRSSQFRSSLRAPTSRSGRLFESAVHSVYWALWWSSLTTEMAP